MTRERRAELLIGWFLSVFDGRKAPYPRLCFRGVAHLMRDYIDGGRHTKRGGVTPTVRITVEGGVVQQVECPPGVRAVVRDYDVDGTDPEHYPRDDDGYPYLEAAWGS